MPKLSLHLAGLSESTDVEYLLLVGGVSGGDCFGVVDNVDDGPVRALLQQADALRIVRLDFCLFEQALHPRDEIVDSSPSLLRVFHFLPRLPLRYLVLEGLVQHPFECRPVCHRDVRQVVIDEPLCPEGR